VKIVLHKSTITALSEHAQPGRLWFDDSVPVSDTQCMIEIDDHLVAKHLDHALKHGFTFEEWIRKLAGVK